MFSVKRLLQDSVEGRKIFRKQINKHKESLDPDNVQNYIDYYIKRMREENGNNPNSTFSGQITKYIDFNERSVD